MDLSPKANNLYDCDTVRIVIPIKVHRPSRSPVAVGSKHVSILLVWGMRHHTDRTKNESVIVTYL